MRKTATAHSVLGSQAVGRSAGPCPLLPFPGYASMTLLLRFDDSRDIAMRTWPANRIVLQLLHKTGGSAMIGIRHTRREVLGAATAVAAATPFAFPFGRAMAQGRQGVNGSRATIDAVLRRFVESKEVPGIVAIAGTDRGVIYEGAFGRRDLAKGPDMTPDTIFRLASMTKAARPA